MKLTVNLNTPLTVAHKIIQKLKPNTAPLGEELWNINKTEHLSKREEQKQGYETYREINNLWLWVIYK